MRSLVPSVAAAALLVGSADACTTIICGRNATIDGSILGIHSDDGGGATPGNFIKVRAASHAAGSVRKVTGGGDIPQVPHTYGYFTLPESYGTMNEFQLGMSESTCSGTYAAKPVKEGGKAMMTIGDLSQVAMERTKTARDAIKLMGALGEKYGFYGDDGGAGESLLVGDTKEAFIFHITSNHALSGAVWGAQRVPDNEVAVVANCFTIRDVTLGDEQNFLYSSTIEQEAALLGWKAGSATIDFSYYFSAGEYNHKYYSGRRMWGAFRLLAPSTVLPAWYSGLLTKEKVYPSTLKVDKKLSREDIYHVMRSHYEGTPFNSRVGIASGPFGSPERWSGGNGGITNGWWERTIAIHRTTILTMTHSRGWLPDAVGGMLWVAPHAAHTSCFVPFAVGMQEVPAAYSTATTEKLDRTKAWWVHRILLNVASFKYNYTIVPINAAQQKAEATSGALEVEVTKAYLANKDIAAVTAAYFKNADSVVATFAALGDTIIHDYADGYCNGCPGGYPHTMGYPTWWMKEVGFGVHPEPNTSAEVIDAACIAECPKTVSDAEYGACVKACL